MPDLLYIDTSGKTATVAVSRKDQPVLLRRMPDAREQAAILNLVISEALDAAGTALDRLNAIAVCAGPGSYTGIRVGLSTAKGLAFALEKPLMLFNHLDLLAAQYGGQGALVIALKARAGEYFYARYHDDGSIAEPPAHRFEEEIGDPGEEWLLTDEPALLPGARRIQPDTAAGIDMPSWVALAEERFARAAFDDLAYSEPFYLKAAYTTQSKK
ncbi:tRNA (adenosine(37)-N6)-threonylcarbamoyltransferase complex dimerization subunit type 1 TsaB [Taibaiella koreensis]|uniref:tRNA (adenosine(37)-N6)-threonylcarbamoyltransferase complex dimerization subunit type 1 TsaB n=1 Tax=Taibaiella koreensis TaxID=1268548 RepID=UPI000E59AB75|nr:tRNA (adenosine(37)-N6)-threonylcarbamoyltransferase complex dimerization subunit type 1 TsaB [Taibaiella koreensis]